MMKIIILQLFLMVAAATQLFAQKPEISAQVYTNAFHNTGASAAGASSSIVQNDGSNNLSVANPYGSKYTLGYGASLQAQMVSGSGFIYGLQAGYEQLNSKVNINKAYPYYLILAYANYGIFSTDASGSATLKSEFINLSPYLGYRLNIKHVKLDMLPGVDIGLALKAHEKGSATTNSNPNTYTVDQPYPKPPTDIRLRMGLALSYGRYGLIASYARGLTNYQKYLDNDSNTYSSKSELFRLGVSYLLF